MHGLVHSADIHDGQGGAWLIGTLFGLYPFLKKLYADSAYRSATFQAAVRQAVAELDIEIVTRRDRAKGFVVLPKRWIVERTIAWLNRCRRLAKDWECRNRKALAFMRLASIRLMLRKLCNPA
jgi:transposase